MKLNIQRAMPESVWEKVYISKEESFEVLIRNPTFEEQTWDMENQEGYTEHRLNLVQNWKGLVHDEDGKEQDIPFNPKNLRIVCQQYPGVFRQLAILVGNRYNGILPEQEKNSEDSPMP